MVNVVEAGAYLEDGLVVGSVFPEQGYDFRVGDWDHAEECVGDGLGGVDEFFEERLGGGFGCVEVHVLGV